MHSISFSILFVDPNQQSVGANPQSSVTSSSPTGVRDIGASTLHGKYGIVFHTSGQKHCIYVVI